MSLCALCFSLFTCFTLCSVPFRSHFALCVASLCVTFRFVLCAVVSTCFALCFVPLCPHVLLLCFVPLCSHVLFCALCRCVHMFCCALCAVVSTCFALCFMPLCSQVLLCLPYLLLWRGKNQSLVDWTFLSQ